jgi:hypothetical protein
VLAAEKATSTVATLTIDPTPVFCKSLEKGSQVTGSTATWSPSAERLTATAGNVAQFCADRVLAGYGEHIERPDSSNTPSQERHLINQPG